MTLLIIIALVIVAVGLYAVINKPTINPPAQTSTSYPGGQQTDPQDDHDVDNLKRDN